MARKKNVDVPDIPVADRALLRRFVLVRDVDVSGTSGSGVVAEGVQFSSGEAVLHWLSQFSSITVFSCVDVMMKIHSHDGKTKIKWVDGGL